MERFTPTQLLLSAAKAGQISVQRRPKVDHIWAEMMEFISEMMKFVYKMMKSALKRWAENREDT